MASFSSVLKSSSEKDFRSSTKIDLKDFEEDDEEDEMEARRKKLKEDNDDDQNKGVI